MKIYHYPALNFGDAMNLWLWPRLLPGLVDEDESTLFIGIGTLLDENVPAPPRKVVFGTGVGYGKTVPIIDDKWKIYCVRGPLSAQALGLGAEMAITDSAVLMRLLLTASDEKRHAVSFIPHWQSPLNNWKAVCEAAGVHFINPEGEVEEVLRQIGQSQLLITEAMHGAISADALRVPWVAVRTHKDILTFKWQDWSQSLGLSYNPVLLPNPRDEERVAQRVRRVLKHDKLKQKSSTRLLSGVVEGVARSTGKGSQTLVMAQSVKALKRVVKNAAPTLSSDRAITEATSRLQERLEQLKSDYASGRLGA